ncbi:MAG: c-type cytochrome biogenesis protein CcsB [Mycobacteriales bacterium]
MPVNQGLAALSDHLFFAAVVAYPVAMLGYAADSARRRAATSAATVDLRTARAHERIEAPALVGATAGGRLGTPPSYAGGRALPGRSEPVAPASGSGGRLGWLAVGVTALGWALHVGSVLARGLAAHRVPWGNMYEFSSMVALVAVTAFLVLSARQRARYLGAFVMLVVVLYMFLAGTVLYAKAGPLVPALNSYWIKIHVFAAITASGTFMVGAIASILYLVRERYERLVAASRPVRLSGVGRLLPSAPALDRTAYRVIAFAFPVWTFAIIAGAIWAEAAWGRYWGWDPKETWSFITWVIFAGYLHARSTAGWRGRKAAWLVVVGILALVVDYYVVNIFITGLHSYAGV